MILSNLFITQILHSAQSWIAVGFFECDWQPLVELIILSWHSVLNFVSSPAKKTNRSPFMNFHRWSSFIQCFVAADMNVIKCRPRPIICFQQISSLCWTIFLQKDWGQFTHFQVYCESRTHGLVDCSPIGRLCSRFSFVEVVCNTLKRQRPRTGFWRITTNGCVSIQGRNLVQAGGPHVFLFKLRGLHFEWLQL